MLHALTIILEMSNNCISPDISIEEDCILWNNSNRTPQCSLLDLEIKTRFQIQVDFLETESTHGSFIGAKQKNKVLGCETHKREPSFFFYDNPFCFLSNIFQLVGFDSIYVIPINKLL